MSKRIKEEVKQEDETKRIKQEPDTLGDELVAINDSKIRSYEKKIVSLLEGKLVPHPLSTPEGCQTALLSIETTLKKEAQSNKVVETISLYTPSIDWIKDWEVHHDEIPYEKSNSPTIYEANRRIREFYSQERIRMFTTFCIEWNKKHPSVLCKRSTRDMHLCFDIRK